MKKLLFSILLITLALNFIACDVDITITPSPDKQHGSSITETHTGTDYSEQTSSANNSSDVKDMFKGDVWQAMLNRPETYMERFPQYGGLDDTIKYLPMPVRFLGDVGLLYQDSEGMYVNGVHISKLKHTPFAIQTATKPSTKENDVYLTMIYVSNQINYETQDDVWVATWKLKYTLSDDDYETFLALEGDFKSRIFIQEMDKIYQPEVLSHAITSFELTRIANPIEIIGVGEGENLYSPLFPDMYISNVDYDNQVITVAALKDNDYYYYDVDMHNQRMLDKVTEEWGCSEEEVLRLDLHMSSKPTMLGECLDKFHIGTYMNSRTLAESQKMLAESTKCDGFEFYDASGLRSSIKVNTQ